MMSRSRSEQLVRLFRAADLAQPVPPGPHPVEDEELLTSWSLGQLSNDEQNQLLEHLAACRTCRQELLAMMEANVVAAPPGTANRTEEKQLAPATRAVLPFRGRRRVRFTQLAFVAAAAILVAAFLFWYRGAGSGPGAELARAEADLQRGQATAALGRLEKLLDGPLDEALRERGTELLEHAGYEEARGKLVQSQFQETEDVATRLDRHGVRSARVENLRLQAVHHIPAEVTLAYAGNLTNYGYDLGGSALPWKKLPILDKATEQQERDWKALVAQHPQDSRLLVNYGQLLLKLSRIEHARDSFAQALRIDPRSVGAEIGLGLVAFERQHYADALAHFKTALRIDPDNAMAVVNAAICLERLGRPTDAQRYWQRARVLLPEGALRQQIDERLRSAGSAARK
jgi:tetratricopeptide (TPR) repeat protein